MPTFKIKDLMISVQTELKEIETIKYCRYPTFHCLCTIGGTITCYAGTNPCYGGTNPCYGGTNPCYGGTNPCYGGTNPCYGGTNPCYGGTNPCYGGTIQCYGGTLHCPGITQICPGGSIRCTASNTPYINPEELELVKQEIADIQKEIEINFAPKGLEEFNQVEAKLNEALAEVKTQKGNLQKGK